MYSEKTFNWLVATAVLLVLGIPVGLGSLYLGFYLGESPCTLCWFIRIGMIVVGILGIFMLRYGPRLSYIAWTNIFAAYGIWMAIRHTAPHFTQDVGMGESEAFFGAHTYTWAVLVYWAVIIFMATMLFLITHRSNLMRQLVLPKPITKKLSPYASFVAVLAFAIVCLNAFQALYLNGLPPNTGKNVPDRFVFDYEKMEQTHTPVVWDRLEHFSLGGKEVIEEPYIKDLSEPEEVEFKKAFIDGPIVEAPLLEKSDEMPITLYEVNKKTDEPILAMARNDQNGELAFVTDELGIFFTDPNATKVTGYVIFDKANGADMKYVAGSAYSGNRLLFIGHNKTLAGVQKADHKVDPLLEFKTFTETTGGYEPTFGKERKALESVRGKHSYINSLASDGKYLYTITLPNKWTQKVVLQKFDTDDWTLSSETLVKPSAELNVKDGRNLNDYYVTGLTYHDGKLLAISPQYSTLLFINPHTAQVEKVYELSGLMSPRSFFVKDGVMHVLDRKYGRDYLVEIPLPKEKKTVRVKPIADTQEVKDENEPEEEREAKEALERSQSTKESNEGNEDTESPENPDNAATLESAENPDNAGNEEVEEFGQQVEMKPTDETKDETKDEGSAGEAQSSNSGQQEENAWGQVEPKEEKEGHTEREEGKASTSATQ